MNTLKKILIALLVLAPTYALATTAVPWALTNTTDPSISPLTVNGTVKAINVTATLATSTIGNFGGVLDPAAFTGGDIGQKGVNAYASGPNYGTALQIGSPTSTAWTQTTQMNFGTANKTANITCAFGGGANNNISGFNNGVTILYVPTTGTSTTFNNNSYVGANASGFTGCNLQGTNGTTARNTEGVYFGGSNGSFGGFIDRTNINGFGTGVSFHPNTSFNYISNSVIHFNGRNVSEPDTSGANCENMRILNSVIADANNQAGGATDLKGFYVQESGNCQWNIALTSFDDNQTYEDQFGGTANVWSWALDHFENPNLHPYTQVDCNPNGFKIVNSFIGGDGMNDTVAGQPDFIHCSGAINFLGFTFDANNNVTGPVTRLASAYSSSTIITWAALTCLGANSTSFVYGNIPCSPMGSGSDWGQPSFYVSSSTANRIGGVGVGTSSLMAKLSVGLGNANDNWAYAFAISSTTAAGLQPALMVVTNTGAIGLGTQKPTEVNANARMTIAGVGSQDYIASTTDNTATSDAIYNAYAPGSRVFMGAHGTNQVTTQYGITVGGWGEFACINSSFGTSNGCLIGTRTSATPIVFGTNSIERMRIDSAGNVGIGATATGARLESKATTTDATSNAFIAWDSNGKNVFNIAGNGSTTIGNFGTCNTTKALTTDSGGNITCGTISAGSGTVNTSLQGFNAFYNTSGSAVSGTSTIFTNTNQNVGIGTTSPFAKLSIFATSTDINRFLFAVGSSTILGATTTLLSLDNTGLLSTSNGIDAYASSTIGNGTAQGGLTISGNSTTTGNTYVGTSLTVGTINTPFSFLIQGIKGTVGIQTVIFQNSNGATGDGQKLFLGTRSTFDTNVGGGLTALRTNAVSSGDTDLLIQNSAGTTLNTNAIVKANGNFGIASSTPAARLAVHMNPTDPSVQLVAFWVGSSTATATTTHFKIMNDGTIFAPNTGTGGGVQTGTWCYDANGQLFRDTAVCAVSDPRAKDIKGTFTGALEQINLITPIVFRYKPEFNGPEFQKNPNFNGDQLGVNAKELQAINPMLVDTYTSDGSNAVFAYKKGEASGPRPIALATLALEGVKELNDKVDAIKGVNQGRDHEKDALWVTLALLGLWNLVLLRRKR